MKNTKKIILFIVAVVILIAFDQYTKYLIKTDFAVSHPDGLSVAGDFLWLYYLENTGAAFGMLKDQIWFFLIIAILMVIVVTWVIFKIPNEKKYLPIVICLTGILAGGIGNMIDRVAFHYVVDFFYVKIINFAIFNVADIYITLGTVFLLLYIMFGLKEEDMAFLHAKKKDE